MARVSEAEVAEIIEYDNTTITDISPFITAANLFVTQKLANSGMTDEYLKEIERWVSAHFVKVRDVQLLEERAGEAWDIRALPKMGEGLKATKEGQQAILLDYTGTLAKAANGRVISFGVMGPLDT